MTAGEVALTINAGSSSVRLSTWRLSSESPALLGQLHLHKGELAPRAALERSLSDVGAKSVTLVAHRVVHGGSLASPRRIDPTTLAEITRASAFAPLHNPVALSWVEEATALLGAAVPQVAVFDTSFFAGIPPEAATYALPRELNERLGLRRFGFHGLAHESLWRAFLALRPERATNARVISLQLGSGCSACAHVAGRALDTSMGLTPLEGLVMGTRSGDVDPGLLLYLQRAEGLDANGLERILDERSGLLGLSGTSADMRTLLESDEAPARLAVSVWCYRVRKYVGAFLAVLGGADAILVGGGIGENSPAIRARILGGLEWCGLALDEGANQRAKGRATRLDRGQGSLEAWVLSVDEEALLVEHALTALRAK